MGLIYKGCLSINHKSSGVYDDLKLCPSGMTPLTIYQAKPQNPRTGYQVGGEKQFGITQEAISFFYDEINNDWPEAFIYSKDTLLEYLDSAEYEYHHPSLEYCNKSFMSTMFANKKASIATLNNVISIKFYINIRTDGTAYYLFPWDDPNRTKYYVFLSPLIANNTRSSTTSPYTTINFYKFIDTDTSKVYIYMKPEFTKDYTEIELGAMLDAELKSGPLNPARIDAVVSTFVMKYRHAVCENNADVKTIRDNCPCVNTAPLQKKVLDALIEAQKNITNVSDLLEAKTTIASILPSSSNKEPLQIIYYGAPGTGKSYKIINEILPPAVEPIRVTFYPDYYYSDFVGGLRPVKNGAGQMEYKFTPGPFTEALAKSFTEETYLVIEEVNRGNAAAIFGDLFQLLDRKGGGSVYPITNHDLYQYLVDECHVTGLPKDKIILPDNLNIICSMNTADQNVFVLDTAFKRRFKMEYVPIDFGLYYDPSGFLKKDCADYINVTDVFNTAVSTKPYDPLNVIIPADLYSQIDSSIKKINPSLSPGRDWTTFALYVNAKIDQINQRELKISEDKKLGPFFVKGAELKNRAAFADKVLFYLKQDVFKYEDNILTSSYETMYDDFVKSNFDIFKIF